MPKDMGGAVAKDGASPGSCLPATLPLAATALLLAATVSPGLAIAGPKQAPPAPPAVDARLFSESPIGLAFAFPYDFDTPARIAERYRGTGAKWVRLGHVPWGGIEETPPKKGVHVYDWSRLDEHVLAWQKEGFNLVVGASAASPWAAGRETRRWPYSFPRVSPFGMVAYPPLDGRIDDYGAFVSAIVERYDGDGDSDAPGLLAPVLHYSFEGSVQDPGQWGGSVRQYGVVLAAAASAVKRASPRARVLGPDLVLADLVVDDPDEARLRQRFDALLPRLPARARASARRLRDLIELLGSGEVPVDVVGFRASGSLDAMPGTVDWLRSRLGAGKARKGTRTGGGRTEEDDLPVWLGELSSGPSLGWDSWIEPRLVDPDEERRLIEIRRALDETLHPRHEEVEAWFRSEQARRVAKGVVLALASGARRVFVSALQDQPRAQGAWLRDGIVDPRGRERPVYDTIALLATKLGPVLSARRIEAGAGVSAWRLELAGGREQVWLWYDDGRPGIPGEVERSTSVAIPLRDAKSASITKVPATEATAAEPPGSVPVFGGRAIVRVGRTPVVVEPVWD